ncbi:phosphoprotein [avian paramyxovirus 7]|uniref:Phosphoprotein n=1 Tax=avian paramyxovirus 7 TaxID=2560317 RepID=C6FGY7_9MONO|nr:phosphoprotein [Avian metaavulavirus 7]ACN72641.1 phosphoprotein [Avian metaavulavirus 7]
MEFSNDAEVAALLDLGDSIIQGIQHATMADPGTLGKSAIPAGNTKRLEKLWEKESVPNHDNMIHSSMSAEPISGELPEENAKTEPTGTQEMPEQIQKNDNLQPASIDNILSSINALESKQVKKGLVLSPQSLKGVSPLIKNQDLKNTMQDLETKPKAVTTVNPLANRQVSPGSLVIDESIPLLGVQEQTNLLSPRGVTQLAPQSDPILQSNDAGAGIAQNSALDVNQLWDVINQQHKMLINLQNQVTKITELVALIPILRSDIQAVKGSCALLEAQLASIRILDPGNIGVSSLDDLKTAGKQSVVINQGSYTDAKDLMVGGGLILDELARPTKLVNPKPQQSSKILDQAEIESVKALIHTYTHDDKKRNKFLTALDKVTTQDQLTRIKQQVLNQ